MYGRYGSVPRPCALGIGPMTLHDQIVTGLKWSAIGKVASQVLSWAVTVVVIRLLVPADYGLMAIIAVIIALLSHASDMGLGSALVQSREISDEQAGAVFGAMLLLAIGISLLLAASGSAIGRFFDDPRLATLVAVAGLQFVVNALAVVPESILRRLMSFKRLALAEMLGALATSLTTLALAMSGYGVWSLVLGNLGGSLVRVLSINVLNPHFVMPNLRLRGTRDLLGFGGYMTASRFAWYFMSQADVLIASKFLGKEALGLYSVSLHLASLPMQKAMSIVNQVAFSAISRVQDQADIARAGLTNTIRLLAYLMTPLLLGLACVAPDFVPVVLGDNWTGAVLPLQLVALAVPLRMLSALLSTAVTGLGQPRVDFRNTLTGLAIMPLCFFVGLQWGEVGLAASWLVGVPLVFLLNFRRTSSVIGLTMIQILVVTARPLLAAMLMSLAILVLRLLTLDIQLAPVRLVMMILVGAAIYPAVALSIDPQLRAELHATSAFKKIRLRFARTS